MDIIKKVRAFICENFLFDEDSEIEKDTLFLENGILDSTGILEIISFVEEEFDIIFEDDDMIPENLDSLENIEKFIKSKVTANG